jgi:tubulin monoglycylase TTLL3/8
MDLSKLLKYVDAGAGSSASTQWIVQKYIENPLVVAKRKFDIRQWVLVTDWNPVTVYFYNEFYVRFSVDEYTTDVEQLENSFVHLVNNSIGKNSENFGKIVYSENGQAIDGYMWGFEDFKTYVTQQTGEDLVTSKIQPRLKVMIAK